MRVAREPARPFNEWRPDRTFRVNDHVGALAYEKLSGYLYGANWDTRQIYVWKPDGVPLESIARQDWLKGAPEWKLAVQDWKAAGDDFLNTPGTLIAGGIDKTAITTPPPASTRQTPREGNRLVAPANPGSPRAVVECYLPGAHKRLVRLELPAVAGYDGPLTREGMCVYDSWLVLLPADVGRNAQLYFFKLSFSP
jgi:hypothetical protein